MFDDQLAPAGPVSSFHNEDAGVGAVVSGATKQRVDDAPEHAKADAKWWWSITSSVPAHEKACQQYERDLQTINYLESEDADELLVQSHTAKKYIDQGVAFLLASPPEAKWLPRRQARGLDDGSGPVGADPGLTAFADTLDVTIEHLLDEAGFADTQRGMVHDGMAFQAAITRLSYQKHYQTDVVTEARANDAQDNAGFVSVLTESLEAGDFTDQDASFHELSETAIGLGLSEPMQHQGLVVENVDLRRFRCAPNVKKLEQFYRADWMSIDVYMTATKILAKFPSLHADDLKGGKLYAQDANGALSLTSGNSASGSNADRARTDAKNADAHMYLVREIEDRTSGRVIVLCEGVDVALDEYPKENAPTQFFSYVAWVRSRRNDGWYGASVAGLVAKTQRRKDRKRTDEERHRPRARSRWGVDLGGALDEDGIQALNNADEDEIVGLKCGAKEFRDAFFEFKASPVDPSLYDTHSDDQEAESICAIPRQSLGTTGDAKFAAEVEAAAAGQNAAAGLVKGSLAEALGRLRLVAAEMVLREADPEIFKIIAGPRAVMPPDPDQRLDLLRRVMPKVTIIYQGALDRQKTLDGIRAVADILTLQIPQAAALAEKVAEVAGLNLDLSRIFKPDPNQLIAQLAQALHDSPDDVQPPAMAALAGMGMEAAARAQAMAPQMPAQPPAQQTP